MKLPPLPALALAAACALAHASAVAQLPGATAAAIAAEAAAEAAATPPVPAPAAATPPAPDPAATATAPDAAAPESQPLGIGQPSTGADPDESRPLALIEGEYRCELNRNVSVRQVSADGRSLRLRWSGREHLLSAVDARTGALRFENAAEGLVWLVIVGKSMLLDVRHGKQLANECRL